MDEQILPQVIFFVFAGLAIFTALMVITQNNPVRCVLFLVATFFASAVLWLMAAAEFLALILILVYVGAVMTLFLFVVMMLDIDTESIKSHFIRYTPFGLIFVALLTSLLIIAIPKNSFKTSTEQLNTAAIPMQVVENFNSSMRPQAPQPLSNTERIGLELYTNYVFAFELAAVLLLVAIIAAITLTHRGVIRSRRQNITRQIMTRREERIELIKMNPEK